MFDENKHTHPQNNDEGPRHIHRGIKRSEPDEVEVDSADFFSPEPPRPKAPPKPTPTPPSEPPKPPVPPRRQWEPLHPSEPTPADDKLPKGGMVLLVLQAILSLAALVQLWRTQMLPVLYLVIITALLVLLWLLVRKCLASRSGAVVARVLSVLLCAALSVGCVWAQQGLTALDSMTSGLLTGAEANKITKEPFVVYLSGVDNRGELTEKARSDVNILAVVNPTTKQAALINTPRDYYVDLAGTDSKDKLTHAGLYGVETSMATLGNLYGVNVEHYLRINFAGFINIIDAIGGVDVYSDQAFTSVGSPGYYDPTTFAEGWNHLDGKSALAFARERHAFKTGDIQRGINQMKVIDAVANKLKSPALLMGFSKLMDAAADCFVTSLSQEQISALVRMQLGDLANWDIQSYTVTGSGAKSTKCYSAKGQSLYVMKPDENSVNEAKALIAAVLGGEDKLTSTSQTPEKTDVFIYSDQHFQRRVWDVCTVKKCKGISNCNAVISTECGAVCRYVSVFDRKVQTVLGKVMFYIRSFFTDHIHMSLKDDGRSVFVSCGCRFVDNDVVQFILNIFETMFFCEIYKIITDLSGVSGTMRDLADFLKIIKDFFWFAIF